MEDVEEFIASLPADEKLIVKRLRSIILEAEPRLREKLSYGVPYFSLIRRICFLWPVSKLPSNSRLAEGESTSVVLGLCSGNLLSNDQGLLLKEGRKQVYVIRFSSMREVNEQAIREIILEAVMVDEQFKKKKQRYGRAS